MSGFHRSVMRLRARRVAKQHRLPFSYGWDTVLSWTWRAGPFRLEVARKRVRPEKRLVARSMSPSQVLRRLQAALFGRVL